MFGLPINSFKEFTALGPYSLGVYGHKLPWEGVYGVFKSLTFQGYDLCWVLGIRKELGCHLTPL